jgi:hypothetical protein
MGVPSRYYVFVDGKTAAGLLTADRLNGNLDPLYACLDPETGGLEDTNVKAGAKIVCTDRVHEVTAAWTFSVCPTIPDSSLPEAKLVLNYATHSPSNDPAAGEKAALPGTSGTPGAGNKYVTDADGRNANARTPTAHHATHEAGGGDEIAAPGYALAVVGGLIPNASDGVDYYFGSQYGASLGSTADQQRMYCPKAGTLKAAYIYWRANGAGGTGEDISVYVRLNNTTDTLIATLGNTAATKIFSKTDLSIAVAQGDYIEIKMVCPTWATNPAAVYLGGVVYIE